MKHDDSNTTWSPVEGHVCRIGDVCLGCRALAALRAALEEK